MATDATHIYAFHEHSLVRKERRVIRDKWLCQGPTANPDGAMTLSCQASEYATHNNRTSFRCAPCDFNLCYACFVCPTLIFKPIHEHRVLEVVDHPDKCQPLFASNHINSDLFRYARYSRSWTLQQLRKDFKTQPITLFQCLNCDILSCERCFVPPKLGHVHPHSDFQLSRLKCGHFKQRHPSLSKQNCSEFSFQCITCKDFTICEFCAELPCEPLPELDPSIFPQEIWNIIFINVYHIHDQPSPISEICQVSHFLLHTVKHFICQRCFTRDLTPEMENINWPVFLRNWDPAYRLYSRSFFDVIRTDGNFNYLTKPLFEKLVERGFTQTVRKINQMGLLGTFKGAFEPSITVKVFRLLGESAVTAMTFNQPSVFVRKFKGPMSKRILRELGPDMPWIIDLFWPPTPFQTLNTPNPSPKENQ